MAYNAVYTVDVKAPQQKVFDYVADVSRHGEWGSADDGMKASAQKPGAPATGSRFDTEGMLNGKLNKSVVTITALDSPRRLGFDAEDANSVFHHEFVFTPADGGTRVERHVSMSKGAVLLPARARDLQGHCPEELQRGDGEPQEEDGVQRVAARTSRL